MTVAGREDGTTGDRNGEAMIRDAGRPGGGMRMGT